MIEQVLVRGDGDSAEKHRDFYDEYLAVMDLTAEFYIQTIDQVFVRHLFAKGEMMHRGRRIDLKAIQRVALMTIEGEKDDITGIGQCRAALDLCSSIPAEMKMHYECPGVGHYGVFNGSRFRTEIAPRIAQFVRQHDPRSSDVGMPVTPRTAATVSAPSNGHHVGYDSSAFAFPQTDAPKPAPRAAAERQATAAIVPFPTAAPEPIAATPNPLDAWLGMWSSTGNPFVYAMLRSTEPTTDQRPQKPTAEVASLPPLRDRAGSGQRS
jgi:poly(3-hydroxybutyrate) depolymerase